MVLKVNPEDKNHPENEEIRRKYGISGYPAIVFLSSKGDLISSNTGFRPPDQFSELMNKTLKEENELKRLRAEIQKNPNDLKINVDLAMIYIKRGNLERGQTLVDKIQELDPSNQFRVLPQVYAEMALAHVNQGNIVEGQALLDKVLALDLKDESAYLSKLHVSFGLFYGQNAEKRGNEDYFQKAEKHFNTVIQKYPQSKLYEGAQLYLGITYAIQEKKQMAISLLEKLSSHTKDAYIQERADHILETLKKQAE